MTWRIPSWSLTASLPLQTLPGPNRKGLFLHPFFRGELLNFGECSWHTQYPSYTNHFDIPFLVQTNTLVRWLHSTLFCVPISFFKKNGKIPRSKIWWPSLPTSVFFVSVFVVQKKSPFRWVLAELPSNPPSAIMHYAKWHPWGTSLAASTKTSMTAAWYLKRCPFRTNIWLLFYNSNQLLGFPTWR